MKTAFLFVEQWLCAHTFPALFKMHKTHSDHGRQTRSFLVFLNRNVGRKFVFAFPWITYSIFLSSTLVFLQYFPVERSGECLEKDNHGRPLFCYSNSINPSSLPVDCTKYNGTELRELYFNCYAIALSTGLGIAVAAALGLAKVAIVGITIFVKVSEGYFNMTKNDPPPKLLKWCCGGNRKRANRIYIVLSCALIMIGPSIITLFNGLYLVFQIIEDPCK